MRAKTIVHLYGFCICMDSAFMGRSTLTTAIMEQFDTLPLQYRHIEHMSEGIWLKKIFFWTN